MAYFDGDLDVNRMPIADRMDTEYRVHVGRLPLELNESAIRDIFGQYGEITGIMRVPNVEWAFVMYGTFREAELAIRELNDKKPLRLQVTLGKERPLREEQKYNVATEAFEKPKIIEPPIEPSIESPLIRNNEKYHSMGRGQLVNALRKRSTSQMTAPYKPHADHGLLPSFSQTSGIYEDEEPYADTNKLWTSGMVTVTSDGRRRVSLGRGFTQYEYPTPFPKIEECISKVYEQRNNGLYEYSQDKLKSGMHSCAVCSTKTIKHCEKCCTYYCSKACQLEDWPQHQAECERIPALVEEMNSKEISLQDVNQTKKSISNMINKTAKSNDVKLRRPNTISAAQVENSSSMNNSMHNGTRDRYLSSEHDNDTNGFQLKTADQPVLNATNTKENFFQQSRLCQHNNSNESTDQLRKNNEHSSTSSSNDQSRYNRNCQSDSNRASLKKERYDNSSVKERTYNNDRNRPRKNDFQNDKSPTSRNGRENTNTKAANISYNASVNNDLDFYKDTHLSKTKFTTVDVVLTLGNGEYWIIKTEDLDARDKLNFELNKVVKISRNVQPVIGETYGVLYGEVWYRATVTSLNPIKVHFIDFGNDEILEKGAETRNIGDLVKAPKLARKIRLTEGTNDEYKNLKPDEKISVRMVSIDSEKTIIVEVQEQPREKLFSCTRESASNDRMKKSVTQEYCKVSPNISTEAPTTQIPNILDAVADLLARKSDSELQIEGAIQIFESSQRNVYSATLTPTFYGSEIEMILEELPEECSKIEASNFKPKAEELICGKCSDGWYRGYILGCPEASSKLFITKIDEARTEMVEKIVPCPKKYSSICALGVMCEINHNIDLQKVGNVHAFTVVLNKKTYKRESLTIEIFINSDKPEVIQAVIKPRMFKTNSNPVLSVLKNGSKICLTSYRNHYYMFARSLDEEQVEYYNHVMQSVTRYGQTAPYLTEPPTPQQIVIAPYEDGNSYRAMVVKTENDKAKIVYIDFGNIDEVNIKDLKVMPLCHSLQQSCAAKIILKDVPCDIPMNSEVDLFIRNLLGKEVPLICTYEGTPTDGVRLTMLTGECVNDEIKELLIPQWKKENNGGNTYYMLPDIKVASLGQAGDTADAFILFIRKDDRTTYIMSPVDVKLLTHIFDVMPAMLKEYCEKTEFYIPRAKELCLALYDGAWYRAACFNPKETLTTAEIFFIDYGNIESVEHKNIRLMPKDFIVPAAIANMCTVVNLAPVDSNGKYSEAVQQKLEELVQLNSSVKVKIVECVENGDYKIELPEVREALIKHGLV